MSHLPCPVNIRESTSETYKSQSKKEKSLIAYAENFQRQFRQLYGDRKPLFLKPPNEYGVEVHNNKCNVLFNAP